MKKIIASLLFSTISSTAFAGIYFDNPTGTPYGAPSWVNIPVELHGHKKFCRDKGFSGSSPSQVDSDYTSAYVTEDASGEWEFHTGNHFTKMPRLKQVYCF